MGGEHPAFAWTRAFEPYTSPTKVLLRSILAQGADVALRQYREFRKTRSGNEVLTERQLNNLGYQLLDASQVKEAIEVFKLNVEDFPNSANAYDSLAEAYMVSGDKELAIKNYRRSVELNPNNNNGIEMLKKLEGKN
jgi:Tfp pilus assembly protein PilF